MIKDNNNWILAEAYVANELPEAELTALQTRRETDPVFAADFQECVNMILSLEGSSRQKRFRDMLRDISGTAKTIRKIRTIPLRTHYLRTGAIAAGIAMLTTLSTFWMVNHSEKKQASVWTDLKKDVESIKKSQNQLIKNINGQRPRPVVPASSSGTGFALTNDGYFVTNYHVTKGADSIYIQNIEGDYFKVSLVIFDEKTDVAILKVENRNFRFGKTELPYTFAAAKRALGAKIFTLGYPQDEIVYNEGYISSINGFQGDSMQYRLELPADPGQSGSPVADASGNIIGIVTGKESETEGTTYAVSTKAIYQLIKELPEKINFPRVNKLNKLNREEQIEKLQYYTCSVKVYNK